MSQQSLKDKTIKGAMWSAIGQRFGNRISRI